MRKAPEHIRLIALDIDGTLFSPEGRVQAEDLAAIKEASDAGIHVVFSSGRPYVGLPLGQVEGSGISYAITVNGGAVYQIPKKLLFESGMDASVLSDAIEALLSMGIRLYVDIFIDGSAYGMGNGREVIPHLALPDSMKHYLLSTREFLPDLFSFAKGQGRQVQKATLNFFPDASGKPEGVQKAREYLSSREEFTVVTGGYGNLELTRRGVTKGGALKKLCSLLSIDPEETMAVGDSENDLDILLASGYGVAMGNASADVLQAADYVTADNTKCGVAQAIRKIALHAEKE